MVVWNAQWKGELLLRRRIFAALIPTNSNEHRYHIRTAVEEPFFHDRPCRNPVSATHGNGLRGIKIQRMNRGRKQINKRRHIACVLLASALMFSSTAAMAVSECAVSIISVWTGAGGEILIVFDNSPSIYVNAPTSATDPAQKNAMAVALTSIATAKSVTIRYATDGVSCTLGPSRSDYAGIWMNR